jgi:hypothetical protein
VLLLKKRFWNLALRTYARAITTRGFTDLVSFIEAAAKTNLHYPSVELMTHPGAVDSETETTVLKDSWLTRLLFEAALISYKEL